jgi:hypothetical protein
MRLFRAAIVIGLIFIGGAISGTTGTYFFVQHRLKQTLHVSPDMPGYADQVANRLQSDWVRKLNLNDSDAEMLHHELASTAHEIKVLRFTTVNRFEEICRETLHRIEARLPEDKRSRFHALAESESKRWGRF